MSDVLIRDAARPDFAAVAPIYAHYVLHSTATFEVAPPSEEELAARAGAVTGAGLPFLVAEDRGEILGYAYAAPYHARPGYRFTVEESVYAAPEARGRGVGRALLDAVLQRCAAAGVREVLAILVDAGDPASTRLHERCGFRAVGRLTGVGYKHGRWLDTVLMQRSLVP